MKIFLHKKELIKFINNENNLGFVPTMGAIHAGHISIFKRSLSECNKTIVTIFVNRPQFNKKNDYKKYPRRINKDIAILKRLKIDYLYLPKSKEIYPNGPNKRIKINKFEKELCGKFRPGHFKSVVDVIDRFIKIIRPKKIYLGEKDMQQLKIVQDFVNKNYKNIKIIECKTIREKNGLAYSSRNFILSNKEKKLASKVYKILWKNKKYLINNKKKISTIKDEIINLGIKKIEYIKILNINKIFRPYKLKKRYKIFIAYYISSVRLIDNI